MSSVHPLPVRPGNHPQDAANAQRQRHARQLARVRALVALLALLCWGLAALSGFLLYLAPSGPRSGWIELLWLTKHQWGELHFWLSVVASIVIGLHIVVDWRALKVCLRYLTRSDRAAGLGA